MDRIKELEGMFTGRLFQREKHYTGHQADVWNRGTSRSPRQPSEAIDDPTGHQFNRHKQLSCVCQGGSQIQEQDLELYSVFNRQPAQNLGENLSSLATIDGPHSSNGLRLTVLEIFKSCKDGIAVVQARQNKRKA